VAHRDGGGGRPPGRGAKVFSSIHGVNSCLLAFVTVGQSGRCAPVSALLREGGGCRLDVYGALSSLPPGGGARSMAMVVEDGSE
jgi:hypothetical protein